MHKSRDAAQRLTLSILALIKDVCGLAVFLETVFHSVALPDFEFLSTYMTHHLSSI